MARKRTAPKPAPKPAPNDVPPADRSSPGSAVTPEPVATLKGGEGGVELPERSDGGGGVELVTANVGPEGDPMPGDAELTEVDGTAVPPFDPEDSVALREFEYSEQHLAGATGVHLDHLRRSRMRVLDPTRDWVMKQSRVAYTSTAVLIVLGDLGLTDDEGQLVGLDLPEVLEKSRMVEAGEVEEVEAVVTRFWPNPQLIEARLPSGELVNVRVGHQKNLRRGMEIPIAPLNANAWQMTRKLPRFPGKW